LKEEELRRLMLKKCPDIMDRNKYLWEDCLSEKKIIMWLENFKGEFSDESIEKVIALDLLRHFLYYSEDEIRHLCKTALSMLIYEKIREDPQRYLGGKSRLLLSAYLQGCVYSYIGYLSESSSHLLYPFRQECDIPISQIIEPGRLSAKNVREALSEDCALIFLDDFCGTGQTGLKFWKSHAQEIQKNHPDTKIYYLALVAMEMGTSRIEDYTKLNVISPVIIKEQHRVFSDRSRVFLDGSKRAIAKEICGGYGERLVGKDHKYGFGDSQVLIGFHHNIPDNTLPIFWSDAHGWEPLFRRKRKRFWRD